MSTCTQLTHYYSSPSLPEPLNVAQSVDGKMIQQALLARNTVAKSLSSVCQTVLDNREILSWMGFQPVFDKHHGSVNSVEEALQRLDSSYWEHLLENAKFTHLMPDARRKAFLSKDLKNQRPPFTEEHVIPTVQSWLLDQDLFFAERVDSIFHALSPTHITNSPAGFGTKLIMNIEKNEQISILDELRLVLSCLLGRSTRLEAATRSYGTKAMINTLINQRAYGKTLLLDSGLLSIKIFKVGTCHIWIDPEMAAHLNDILSMLYPHSIPAKFRSRTPVKAPRYVASAETLIPMPIMTTLISALNDHTLCIDRMSDLYTLLEESIMQLKKQKYYSCVSLPKGTVIDSTWKKIAQALGAILDVKDDVPFMVFDYSTKNLPGTLSLLGTLPDLNAFQFFPSKGQIASDLATRVMAHHDEKLQYLEPSAGHGDLIDQLELIPKNTITTVELSPLFATILQAKQYKVVQHDFLSQAKTWFTDQVRFDRVVMNPPFCRNQAKDHTVAAHALLNEKGILFAILPMSLYHAFDDKKGHIVKSAPYNGAFEHTNVTTFILEWHK